MLWTRAKPVLIPKYGSILVCLEACAFTIIRIIIIICPLKCVCMSWRALFSPIVLQLQFIQDLQFAIYLARTNSQNGTPIKDIFFEKKGTNVSSKLIRLPVGNLIRGSISNQLVIRKHTNVLHQKSTNGQVNTYY